MSNSQLEKQIPLLLYPPLIEVIFELHWELETDKQTGRVRDPSYPMLYGRLGNMRILGLPGNPVSSLICGRVFMVPLIKRLTGLAAGPQRFAQAVAAVDLDANGPRTHYMRATLEQQSEGPPAARPMRSQDSSLLSPLAAADCLLIRPVGAPPVKAGEPVPVLPLDF